ncbi:dATP/dGTP pyrophosphohydrolase domain-containing protein, partial [Pseudomonas aeruginosa]
MTLTTERLKWLHDAATELSATKLKMTMRPDELLVLTSELMSNREAQPVQGLDLAGWQFKSVNGDWLGILDEHGKNQAVREGCEVREVYAMADSPNYREAVREAHAEWSRSTFDNVGPIGPLKHLSKEALEAAAQPDDLSEWADMQFLLWDAQRRAGITDEQITQAMIE